MNVRGQALNLLDTRLFLVPLKQKRLLWFLPLPSRLQNSFVAYAMLRRSGSNIGCNPAKKALCTYIFCKICSSIFSVASGGMHEVKRHITAKRHWIITTKFLPAEDYIYHLKKRCLTYQVIASEIYLATFAAKHFSSWSLHCKSMFPRQKNCSTICSRTKLTAIINKALSPTFSNEVVQACRTLLFILMPSRPQMTLPLLTSQTNHCS